MKRLPGSGSQIKVFAAYRFTDYLTLPTRKGIGTALTGYFTYEQHDAIFQAADQTTDVSELPDTRILNLRCYRSARHAGWWPELWARAAETVDDKLNKPILEGSTEPLWSMSQGIRPAHGKWSPAR